MATCACWRARSTPCPRISSACGRPNCCWRWLPRRAAGKPRRRPASADWHFDARAAANALAEHFGTRDLAGFGVHNEELALAAAGALYRYAQATQLQALAHVTQLTVEREGSFLRLDAATRRNLEISETLRGEAAPTLLSLLDTCATSMGSRWLRHCLHHPLTERDIPRARHEPSRR